MVGSADQCSFRALAQSMRSGDESMSGSSSTPFLTANQQKMKDFSNYRGVVATENAQKPMENEGFE